MLTLYSNPYFDSGAARAAIGALAKMAVSDIATRDFRLILLLYEAITRETIGL